MSSNHLFHAVTHSSKFHADDVLATAVLKKVYPQLKFTRTRDSDLVASADIVYDLGGVYDHQARRYDHHQLGSRKREDTGLTYSAFGLIWDHYGLDYCQGNHQVWRYVDNLLVKGIDANDNGEAAEEIGSNAPQFTMPQIINHLNPLSGGDEDYDKQFWAAVDFASGILERMVARLGDDFEVAKQVRSAQQSSIDTRYAELDKAIVMNDMISNIDGLEFLLFPDKVLDTWRLYAVNVAGSTYDVKRPFPESWAGLRDDDLVRVTGIGDAVFCHKNRFLTVAKSRAGALALLNLVLDQDDNGKVES